MPLALRAQGLETPMNSLAHLQVEGFLDPAT